MTQVRGGKGKKEEEGNMCVWGGGEGAREREQEIKEGRKEGRAGEEVVMVKEE
jgi:hypothetical protein